jgi:hypothetical protein
VPGPWFLACCSYVFGSGGLPRLLDFLQAPFLMSMQMLHLEDHGRNIRRFTRGGDRGMPPEGSSVLILLLLGFLYTMIPGVRIEAGLQVLWSKQCKQTKV